MDVSVDIIHKICTAAYDSAVQSILTYTADPVGYAKKHGKLEGINSLTSEIKAGIIKFLRDNGEEDDDDIKSVFK